MNKALLDLVSAINNKDDRRRSTQLAQDVKTFLWARYDPCDDLIYPTIGKWDDLLTAAMNGDKYYALNKGEVLSILFGLIHRNRIVEGLWWSMLERDVVQELLAQLLALESDEC